MIYKSSKTLTFVIYEDQRPAKCFEVKKGQVKFLFLLIPFIVILSVMTVLFVFAYIKNLKVQSEKEPPPIIEQLKNEKNILLKNQQELQDLNKSLLSKIESSGESSETTSILPFFRPILGQEDLTGQSPLAIKNLSTQVISNSLKFTFDLVNIQPEQTKSPITGYVFVLMKDQNLLTIFPPLPFDLKEAFLTKFDLGEKFTVTRFRPVVANFARPSHPPHPIFFKIFIFSKTGDLLFQKAIGPITY